MKSLFILIALAPLSARAGTFVCSAPGLSYELSTSDGGAPIGPTIQLVYQGKTLIDVQPFGRGTTSLARIDFDAKRNILKTVKTPDYVTTTFESVATLTMNDATAPEFKGIALCQEARYVGPPRP